MNLVILSGHLGKDPELRYTASGAAVCNFSLATSDREKVHGEWKDVVVWHDVVVWAKTAENVAKFVTKGSKVLVHGRIKKEKWQAKDGSERISTKIFAEKVEFLSSRTDDRPTRPTNYDEAGQTATSPTMAGAYDDIPF